MNFVSDKWGTLKFLAASFIALYSGFIFFIQYVSRSSKLCISRSTSSIITKAKLTNPYFKIALEIGLPFCASSNAKLK